jgi:thiol:disulfide interchange protein DsbD
MKNKITITIIIIVMTAGVSFAQFQGSQNVKAELISEVQSVKPGEKFWVALKLNMAKKWHTYWRNPGDAGLPTEIDWTLPDNFKVSDIYWPSPENFETGGVVTYGYKDEILLLSEVTPPDEINSDFVEFEADVSWLECRETCLPGGAEVSLKLSVNNDMTIYDKRWKDRFIKTRKMLPAKNNNWIYVSNQTDSSIIIETVTVDKKLSDSDKVRFLPYDEGIYNTSKPQGFEFTPRGFLIEVMFADFKVADPKRVSGILKLEKPDGNFKNAFEIMVPIKNY